jgi:hypothetical protein
MVGDHSDGWKFSSLPSAIGSLEACGYSLADVETIMRSYRKELRDWAVKLWKYYNGRRVR